MKINFYAQLYVSIILIIIFVQSSFESRYGCNLNENICELNEYCNNDGTIFGKCENIENLLISDNIAKRIEYNLDENDDSSEDNIIQNDLPILVHKYQIENEDINSNEAYEDEEEEEEDDDDESDEIENKLKNLFNIIPSNDEKLQDDFDIYNNNNKDPYVEFLLNEDKNRHDLDYYLNNNKNHIDDENDDENYNIKYDDILIPNRKLTKRNIYKLTKLNKNISPDNINIDQYIFDDNKNNDNKDIFGYKHIELNSKKTPNELLKKYVENNNENIRQKLIFEDLFNNKKIYKKHDDGFEFDKNDEQVAEYNSLAKNEDDVILSTLNSFINSDKNNNDDDDDDDDLILERLKAFNEENKQKNSNNNDLNDEEKIILALNSEFKKHDEDLKRMRKISRILSLIDRIEYNLFGINKNEDKKIINGTDVSNDDDVDEIAIINNGNTIEVIPIAAAAATIIETVPDTQNKTESRIEFDEVIKNAEEKITSIINEEEKKQDEFNKDLEEKIAEIESKENSFANQDENNKDILEKIAEIESKENNFAKQDEKIDSLIDSIVDKKSENQYDSEKYMAIDSLYTIHCNKNFTNDIEAKKLLKLLKLDENSIKDISIIDGNSIKFFYKPYDSTINLNNQLENTIAQNENEIKSVFGNDFNCDVTESVTKERIEAEDERIQYFFIAILSIAATISSVLIAILGICLVRRRRYLKNSASNEFKSKGNEPSDFASIITDASTSASDYTSTTGGITSSKCEWKTFWPFKKNDCLTNNDQSSYVKQDYEELCRNRAQSKQQQETSEISTNNDEKLDIISTSTTILPTTSTVTVTTSIAQVKTDTKESSRSSTSSWSEEPINTVNMDITTGHAILSYMEEHLNDKSRIEKDWEALSNYTPDINAHEIAELPLNTTRNRYSNILPYDHTRVLLKEVKESDYINASAIMDHDPKNAAYIATQGPLPHTTNNFWQMIWEQSSVLIVNLSKTTESGSVKCHQYWPTSGCEVYDKFEVNLVSEHLWCEEYLVRNFYLKNTETNESRTVTQFHFLSWLENEIPKNLKTILDFRRKINKSYKSKSCPIIVHCNDGIGRTGTFILIDMVLNKIVKGIKEINIAATLEYLRDQRQGMVKTKAQFEFAFAVITEELQNMLKALSS